VYFAGGYTGAAAVNVIDTYSLANGVMRTYYLSSARFNLAAATVGTIALFAGGRTLGVVKKEVDLFNSTSIFAIQQLEKGRYNLVGISVNNIAIFAGGNAMGGYSDLIDMYSLPAASATTSSGDSSSDSSNNGTLPSQ
jgi:hypothetical protein